ncbi:hypothetical protein HPO96_33600 [Kribbella sandramycini]|uniref:O-methyltransferase involved in polyketide biosynthesis n=1 Tax=Kribbella sandramycini TaxID=60450 RepID=A0A7Y4L6A3_9ACTN|nr:hypothetical protein [Kribbella sandramycini]MBB6570331.1 O-methyltransferase involved in polyketide biosynthesis [Kribbella sandramycini]NOL45195.1 hypothetical protein [Kribbella sandramycini]
METLVGLQLPEGDAVDGIQQIVVLGTELDSRAHRPGLFLVTDLRGPWVESLIVSGFRPGERSLWIADGVADQLTGAELAQLRRRIGTLSAPGSRLVMTSTY